MSPITSAFKIWCVQAHESCDDGTTRVAFSIHTSSQELAFKVYGEGKAHPSVRNLFWEIHSVWPNDNKEQVMDAFLSFAKSHEQDNQE